MKNLILGAVALGTGLLSTANAQIQKGNWMVGSSLVSSKFGLNTNGGYSIAVQPKLTYFIKDNVAIGGYVDLGISKINSDSNTRFDYGVGALGRYYVSPGEAGVDSLLKHGRWFFEGNLGIGGNSTKGSNSTTGVDFGVGPGYSYFITPNIGVEGLVKYTGNTGFGNVGLTSNITFNVGFSIYLPSKKIQNIAKDVK